MTNDELYHILGKLDAINNITNSIYMEIRGMYGTSNSINFIKLQEYRKEINRNVQKMKEQIDPDI